MMRKTGTCVTGGSAGFVFFMHCLFVCVCPGAREEECEREHVSRQAV